VAGERIREELLRLLALPGAGKVLFRMDDLVLLTALVPELAPGKGIDQPHAHVYDVFEHSSTPSAGRIRPAEGDWDTRAELPCCIAVAGGYRAVF